MELNIGGRTALVCAATSGLGLATARSLAAEGVRVLVNSSSDERVADIVSELPGAVGVPCDLVAPGGGERLLEMVVATGHDVDILILNGPGPSPGPARDVDRAGVQSAIDALVQVQVELIRGLLPGMVERRWGRILSVSSTSVQAPIAQLALSNLGRAALLGYLKTLAAEVAADGVTVNSILPGRIATPRITQLDGAAAQREGRSVADVEAEFVASIPAGRYGDPEGFGSLAAFLCSEQAGYVTGSSIRYDGGMSPTP